MCENCSFVRNFVQKNVAPDDIYIFASSLISEYIRFFNYVKEHIDFEQFKEDGFESTIHNIHYLVDCMLDDKKFYIQEHAD